jgi:hypothetical protein
LIGEVIIPVEIRRTPAELSAGLSGRLGLPPNQGMLFIFKRKDYHSFWMPDMNFPIDIIWITGGKIVGIHDNVSNDFDPKNPVYYHPPQPVEYVLEVNAGFMEKNNLTVGDVVIFQNI